MDIENYQFSNNNSQILTVCSLGDRLREARESMGLSQKKVADSLCLKVFIIRSIEEGHIDKLGITSIFLRGYICSYARLVGIDIEEVMTPSVDKSLYCSSSKINKTYGFFLILKKCKSNIKLLIIIFSIIILVIWYLKCVMLKEKKFSYFYVDSMIDFPVYPWDKNYLSCFLEQGCFNVKNFNTLFDKNYYFTNIRGSFVVLNPYFSEILSDGLLLKVQDFGLYEDLDFCRFHNINIIDNNTCIDSNILVMNFTADCWIEVLDASGKILCVGTQHAGNILKLIGEVPYKVVIGAPRAVEIKYRGHILNLDEFIQSRKIARLVVPS